jgi:peptidoglycan hydrolase-like protein with peptidoglycan-binding domain
MSAAGGSHDAPGVASSSWGADVEWDVAPRMPARPPRAAPARPATPARPARPPTPPQRHHATRATYRRRRLVALAAVLAVAVTAWALLRSPGRPVVAAPLVAAHVATTGPGGGGGAGTPAGPPAGGATVRPGDHGPAVAGVQAALADLGAYSGAQDGAFGSATRMAVAAFQRGHGLPADGVVGGATATAVGSALAALARHDAAAARAAIAAARGAGRISPPEAAAADAAVAGALNEVGSGRMGAAAAVAAVLRDVATQSHDLDAPRARALYGMLDANVRRFRSGGLPAGPSDIRGRDGIVYRYFAGHGYQFHPLATFGALAAAVTAGRSGEARRIASAMLARAVPVGGTLVWEYEFPFGGPSRWTSGFAQAAGADALARAAKMLGDAHLAAGARKAFAAIPAAYLHPIAGGAWIREYSFSSLLILNAQLQTFLLVRDYARTSGDGAAAALAGRLETAARRLLPRFDTGCWSRYSLGGSPASQHYHAYHIRLLRQIAAATGQRSWATVADRWQGYLHHGCSPG